MIKPQTPDEWIVLMWQQGKTTVEIADRIGWSNSGVRTRIGQLRLLGVPLTRRKASRYDLEALEVELDLVRLRQIAVEAKRGVRR